MGIWLIINRRNDEAEICFRIFQSKASAAIKRQSKPIKSCHAIVIDDEEHCRAWKFIFHLSTACNINKTCTTAGDGFQLKLFVWLHSKQLTKLNLSLLQWVTREIKSCCWRQRWTQLLFLKSFSNDVEWWKVEKICKVHESSWNLQMSFFEIHLMFCNLPWTFWLI